MMTQSSILFIYFKKITLIKKSNSQSLKISPFLNNFNISFNLELDILLKLEFNMSFNLELYMSY